MININEYIVEENELKELGLDKEIKIPSVSKMMYLSSKWNNLYQILKILVYISLDSEDNNFVHMVLRIVVLLTTKIMASIY